MMRTMGVPSSVASQRASPWPRQVPDWCCCKNKFRNLLPCYQKSQMKLGALPRLSYSVKEKTATIRTESFNFGVVGSRFVDSEKGGLGLVSSRIAVVRAQEEDKEGQELDKAEKKSTESWSSSIQRVRTVSRIFLATFVWICLFLWMSVTNGETGGGRPGRRGPRK